MKHQGIKKRIGATLVALLLLASSLLTLSSCGMRAPRREEIYDRVVELVEASMELNTVFYGVGLPVFAEGSDYAELQHLYFQNAHPGYEMVTPYAKFLTVYDIKTAAEAVFSKEYLEKVVYVTAFDGHAISDGKDGMVVANARYFEDESWIYRSQTSDVYPIEKSVYDFASMRVSRPSNGRAAYVTLNAYPENGGEAREVRLRLVKDRDDGLWYLDSFTG